MTDLNDDCLYLIFNELVNKYDLANLTQINPHFAHIASNVFRQKYSHFDVQMGNDGPYDLKAFSNIMKSFGQHIQNVIIHNPHHINPGSVWAKANRIANEYGSNSVTQLQLGVITQEAWSEFTVPFEKVEKLIADIRSEINEMKLNQVFPNVREVHFNLTGNANFTFIDCAMPHLEHLNLVSTNWNQHQRAQIHSMMQKNPQIRSVDTTRSPNEFKKMCEQLPQLENLTLKFNDDDDDSLHFETVKHCELQRYHFNHIAEQAITKLSFSQLESFEFTYSVHEFGKYREFLQRHRNLRQLRVKKEQWGGGTLPLEALTTNLLDEIEEMIIEFYSGIYVENVFAFIGRHQKLTKFQFPVHQISMKWCGASVACVAKFVSLVNSSCF